LIELTLTVGLGFIGLLLLIGDAMAAAPQLKTQDFDDGSFIYVDGKKSDSFYIIRKGKARISGTDIEDLVAGDFLGMVSVMSDHTHYDNAEAIGAVSTICIHREQFIDVIQNNPSIAMKIILEFSKRMRSLNESLAVATNKPISSLEDTTILYKSAEYYEKEKRLSQAYYAYEKYLSRFPDGEFAGAAKSKLIELKASAPLPHVTGIARLFPKGSFVFADGEKGEELFVILAGQVQICKVLGGTEMIFTMLKTGDIFGEMAIMEDKPRSASAIAYEDSKIMLIKKSDFGSMAATKPDIIERLTVMLADRIWYSYKQLGNLQLLDPVGRMYDALATQMEKEHFTPSTKTSFVWHFGLAELMKMTNVSEDRSKEVKNKFKTDAILTITDTELIADDSIEVAKMAEFYKGQQRRANARAANKMR
jgi:CRP-like cAMP-binding protein